MAGWVVVAYGFTAILYVLTSHSDPAGPLLARMLLVVPAAGAAVMSGAAVRALPPAAIVPWSMLGTSATLALFAAATYSPASPWHDLSLVALLFAYAIYALAMAWMVHQRDFGRGREITLDGLLIVAVCSAALIRWSPAVRQAVLEPSSLTVVQLLTTIGIPVAGACSLTLALVLLVSRRRSGAADCAAGIAGTAGLLAITALPVLLGDVVCCPVQQPYGLAWIAGWGFLSLAAARVVRGGAAAFSVLGSDPGGGNLRQMVAPAAALLIAVIVVDASSGPALLESTAVLLAIGCGVIAFRVTYLLEMTRQSSADRRELHHTRALVDVSRALSGTPDLDQTLDVVTHWTCRLLDAEAALIELVTEDGQRLELRAAAGLPADVIGYTTPVDGSFTGWVVRHGKPRATTDPRREPDIREESRPIVGKMPTVAAPLRYHDRTLGVLACMATRPFDLTDFDLLGALADQAAVAIENARLFKEVDTLSKRDPLTGLSNRRQLELDLAREFAAAQRGRKVIAAIFDVNEFKDYNDRYGHLAGDEVLRLFGEVLAAETRAMNPAARYGGDEFVALLTDTDLRGAQLFTERVRLHFSQTVARQRRRTLSVSAGYAEYTPDMRSPDDLIDAADRALYASKANKPKTG